MPKAPEVPVVITMWGRLGMGVRPVPSTVEQAVMAAPEITSALGKVVVAAAVRILVLVAQAATVVHREVEVEAVAAERQPVVRAALEDVAKLEYILTLKDNTI